MLVIVPESQENEWEHLGFANEIELIESSESWDAAVAGFQAAIESFGRLRTVTVRVEDSMRQFIELQRETAAEEEQRIRESQEMAIDIRHGEYPGRDSYGTYWYDPSGFHSDDPHVCFICHRPTCRIDIDFDGAFCNSEECNEVIRLDLERLNGGPENAT